MDLVNLRLRICCDWLHIGLLPEAVSVLHPLHHGMPIRNADLESVYVLL